MVQTQTDSGHTPRKTVLKPQPSTLNPSWNRAAAMPMRAPCMGRAWQAARGPSPPAQGSLSRPANCTDYTAATNPHKNRFAPHTRTLKWGWNRTAAAPMRAPHIGRRGQAAREPPQPRPREPGQLQMIRRPHSRRAEHSNPGRPSRPPLRWPGAGMVPVTTLSMRPLAPQAPSAPAIRPVADL